MILLQIYLCHIVENLSRLGPLAVVETTATHAPPEGSHCACLRVYGARPPRIYANAKTAAYASRKASLSAACGSDRRSTAPQQGSRGELTASECGSGASVARYCFGKTHATRRAVDAGNDSDRPLTVPERHSRCNGFTRCHFRTVKRTPPERGFQLDLEEPTPGLEPGTPSLRVKCSGTTLFLQARGF
jgi:hypothetical protein